ncbi:phage tail tube protein [Pseudoruegeria sp. HB172150]|uniref:phage tail tube protein n=1 Tax=Pseudoruegeria sp. HB172150 TaxID=2721164 RepID=UPI001556A1AF|nr:phage tail tube protein [Pseudoruegeria sp. HB172150]
MAEPLKWRSKVLLAKIESEYGTDSTPTGAANAILATQVELSPMLGNDIDRDLETPFLGPSAMIPSELHRQLKFRVELQTAGTAGVAPAWGPLLRACACAETIVADTSVTYNPISDGHESVVIYIWVSATRYRMLGTRGNAIMMIDAQGIPYIEFTFTGLYSPATEVAQATPDLTAFQKPSVATNSNTPSFTIDATEHVLRSFQLDLANQVENRFLIGDESIIITDKKDMIRATIQAVPVTTLDPYSLAEAQTEVAVEIVHGTVAGKIATLNAPTCQVMRQEGLENRQNLVEWPLRFSALPASGNDQWTLALT